MLLVRFHAHQRLQPAHIWRRNDHQHDVRRLSFASKWNVAAVGPLDCVAVILQQLCQAQSGVAVIMYHQHRGTTVAES